MLVDNKMLALKRLLWPDVVFYDKQIEAIESVERDDETVLVAGNQLGKDYVAGFIVLAFFLTRHPCRIITTSVKDKHLSVLWGEIGEFIRTSAYPLNSKFGGPLIINHQHLRKIVGGSECPLSYVMTMVANPENAESFQGHHVKPPPGVVDNVPRNMFVSDEASGVPNAYYEMADTWARRKLIFGNPWDCDNFFKKAVKGNAETKDSGGDTPDPTMPGRYYRKVIKISAEDSPNVQLGLLQKSLEKKPTDEILIPGVKSYSLYVKHRLTWDKIKQCVALDAEFYEGAENLLYPPEWLNEAEALAETLSPQRRADTMGVDPAEGGDSTVWTLIDGLGVIDVINEKTPDTSVIVGRTIKLMREHKLSPGRVLFDRGGGGKQHADRLRAQGINVRTVAFGTPLTPEKMRGLKTFDVRKGEEEERYVYFNRRAQMYGMISLLLDPAEEGQLAIPAKFTELRRQLAPIPRIYNEEGRMILPPKRKKPGAINSNVITLTELIGCSPDEADALALAVYGRYGKKIQASAGAAW